MGILSWDTSPIDWYCKFSPPVRSCFTVHSVYWPGRPGWHFCALYDFQGQMPQRVVLIPESQIPRPGPSFYCHRVLGLRVNDIEGSKRGLGTLFRTDSGKFLAYAINGPDGPSVLCSDWTRETYSERATHFLVQRVCKEMGWGNEYCESGGRLCTKSTLLIGADPEFEVAILPELPGFNGAMVAVYADGYVSVDVQSDIGTDKTGMQIELRPNPSHSPEELYKEIRALADRAITLFADVCGRECVLLLSGHFCPLGCHIHIGTAEGLVPQGVDKFIRLVDGFSTPLGELGELMIRLSGNARGEHARRAYYSAGKDHGGFEYRTPPSSILAFPETFIYVAGVIMSLATDAPAPAFPKREFEYLLSLIERRRHFTFGGREVKCTSWIFLGHEHAWSASWRRAIEAVRRPAQYRTKLFGYAPQLGLVTNCPELARAFGWQYVKDDNGGIGIPSAVQQSNNDRLIGQIITRVVDLPD